MSTRARASSCGFWGIDVLVLTQRGRPVAMLRSLDDDLHVQTRLCQYEAVNNEKGVYLAKQFVLGKFYGQNNTLEKYGLKQHAGKYVQLIEKIEFENKLHM
jgi:CRISPR/Cas system-associated endonuclease Cas1